MKKEFLAILLILLSTSLLVANLTVPTAAQPNPNRLYAATVTMPETVDPHWAYDTASCELVQNIYEPLCMFDDLNTGKFVAGVADTWPGYGNPDNITVPSPPDPTAPPGTAETWYFHIRTSNQWQNTSYGFVTPADVEHSFERGMLVDPENGPMWMLYGPVLGVDSSDAYDLDSSGTIDAVEFSTLLTDVTGAIGSNATHVWFNLVSGYAPFQQILSQTWSVILCKQWCIDQGSWNPAAADLYLEFLRIYRTDRLTWTMGSGPYKLDEFVTGSYWSLARHTAYWGGWPAPGASGYADFVTTTYVEQWTARDALFLSTNPASQADFVDVPRKNTPELHTGGNINAPVLPGITYWPPLAPTQAMDFIFFNYYVASTSPYVPKLGNDLRPDLLSDRQMRLCLSYLFNFTQFIQSEYLDFDEAMQSRTYMPPGSIYYNATKSRYDIDLVKAQQYLDFAWFGMVKQFGLTLRLIYNIGDVARQTACQMIVDNLKRLSWGPDAMVDVQAVGLQWLDYRSGMKKRELPVFVAEHLASFPDPYDWLRNCVLPNGSFGLIQSIVYGLDQWSMNWEDGYSLPYESSLGGTVNDINNTYVATLIFAVLITPNGPWRQAICEELMDIFHAEASAVPIVAVKRRHYERDWVNGWIGKYSENAISPGRYYYTMWKVSATPPTGVWVDTYSAELSPESNITTYLINQPYWAPQIGKPWMKSCCPDVNVTALVQRTDYQSGYALVYLTLNGYTSSGTNIGFGSAYASMLDGEDFPVPIGNVSGLQALPGQYDIWIRTYVLGNCVNTNPDPDYNLGYVKILGYCDLNGDYVVDGKDFVLVKKAIPSLPGQGGLHAWNWAADVNCSNSCTVVDYQLVKTNIPTVYTPA